jgi:hypothetical protein
VDRQLFGSQFLYSFAGGAYVPFDFDWLGVMRTRSWARARRGDSKSAASVTRGTRSAQIRAADRVLVVLSGPSCLAHQRTEAMQHLFSVTGRVTGSIRLLDGRAVTARNPNIFCSTFEGDPPKLTVLL